MTVFAPIRQFGATVLLSWSRHWASIVVRGPTRTLSPRLARGPIWLASMTVQPEPMVAPSPTAAWSMTWVSAPMRTLSPTVEPRPIWVGDRWTRSPISCAWFWA